MEKSKNRMIEKSIIKKYRKDIWSKFIKAIKEYNMIEDGDKIAVAISGGKDSLIMAKILQEFKRHNLVKFDLEFISMNPGFNQENLDQLIYNCKMLEIPVKILDSHIFEVVDNISREYPCYLCARMRRGFLYNAAKESGCNKLALGHHFDDVIETTLLNIFYAGTFKTMLPKINSDNYPGLQLIRPMYHIKEKAIINWAKYNGIEAMDCGCSVSAGKISSKRREIKELIHNLRKSNKDIDKCIFQSAKNVNLDSVLGWSKDDIKYNYLKNK